MPILREPFVHFTVAGALLFLLYSAVAQEEPFDSREISLDGSTVDALALAFEASFGRAPDSNELEAVIDAWVDEEVLYREALALSLDADDTIVRRRLIQKMRFVLEEGSAPEAPSEAEVDAYLQEHGSRFATEPRRALTHVFVDPARVTEPSVHADRILADLHAGADPATLGWPFPRGARFSPQTRERFAAIFGSEFASSVVEAPSDTWVGPVSSVFGLHLIRVGEPQVADGGETRARRYAAELLLTERAEAAAAEAVASLRARYTISRP